MRAPFRSTGYGDASDDPQRHARRNGQGLAGWRSERAGETDNETRESGAYDGYGPSWSVMSAATAVYPVQPTRPDTAPGMTTGMTTGINAALRPRASLREKLSEWPLCNKRLENQPPKKLPTPEAA